MEDGKTPMTDEKKYLPARRTATEVQGSRPFQITTLEDAARMGQIFVEAGLFEVSEKEQEKGMTEARKTAIATVKVVAGASMGISPFAAMRGLHIVKGKVEPGYQTCLALVRRHGYDYKVLKQESDGAAIEWFGKDGESLGISTHDEKDRIKEGLGGNQWQKYPRQMHFARAVRIGFDAHCSEVLDGPIHTGSDADYNEVIEAEGFAVEEQTSTPEQSAATKKEGSTASSAPAVSTKEAKKETPKPATTQTAATPAQKTTSEADSKNANATATDTNQAAPADEEIADAETVDEIQQASDGERPGQAQLDEILQTGVSNGWSEDQIESWLMGFLESKKVDLSNPTDSIFATWTFEIVAEACTHLATNKPGA